MIYVTGVINTGLIMKNASYCFFRYSVPGKGRFVLRDFRTTIHKMAICWIEPFPKLTVWGEIILLLNSVLRAIFPLLLHKASFTKSAVQTVTCDAGKTIYLYAFPQGTIQQLCYRNKGQISCYFSFPEQVCVCIGRWESMLVILFSHPQQSYVCENMPFFPLHKTKRELWKL